MIAGATSESDKRSRGERILEEAILDRLRVDEIKLLFCHAGARRRPIFPSFLRCPGLSEKDHQQYPSPRR